MASVLILFIREFFDQNPLSHLGIIIMRNGRSERLTELSASPVRLIQSKRVCLVSCDLDVAALSTTAL